MMVPGVTGPRDSICASPGFRFERSMTPVAGAFRAATAGRVRHRTRTPSTRARDRDRDIGFSFCRADFDDSSTIYVVVRGATNSGSDMEERELLYGRPAREDFAMIIRM